MNERSHLKRLHVVWDKHPVYFITTCTAERRPLLANEAAHEILHAEWCSLHERHGWQVGRYIVMPDHVHLLVRLPPTVKVSEYIGHVKGA